MEKKIYTVSRLNQEVLLQLEKSFGTLWLQGELSNFSRPGSGHFYFTLKDSRSQIRCAMFKGRNRYVDFNPQNGDAVLVRGKLSLYAPRGDFQLIVEHMEPEGAGKLQAAFEATKRALADKGWFDQSEKQPLPRLPQTIGIVSSPTGAALRDVLQVLRRRYRQARVIIYPTLTQGKDAAPNIVRALAQANSRNEADVLLLVRGGGSLEDLWAFNELSVAAAIRESQLPIVAGIGHEVDLTISDLVSDLRAPTPSAAAELATPDTSTLAERVGQAHKHLLRTQQARLAELNQRLSQHTARLHLQHPERRIQQKSQQLDDLERRLARAWDARKNRSANALQHARNRLNLHSPDRQLARHTARLQALDARLQVALNTRYTQAKSRFDVLARALHNISPLAVLDRGYAIVKKNDRLVTNAGTLSVGDEINTRLANGEIKAIVKATGPAEV